MKWATCLPMWGKQLTHLGQAPCPKWARVVPKTVPKVSIERNVSKGMQSANITDSFLLMRNQKSILIDSQIYLFRVVVVVSPAFSRDTNQKMKHGLHRDSRISLSRIFFDIIELMILGFGLDLFGFASAGALPFPGGIAIVTPHIDNSPHLTSNPS